MECVVNEHGVAQIPSLRAAPEFNLEQEFAGVEVFTIEPAGMEQMRGNKARPEKLTRAQLEALAAPGSADKSHDDHDD
jgi:hypothetical protein